MERGMERRAVVLIARRGSGRVFVPGVEIDAEACSVRFVRRVNPAILPLSKQVSRSSS
jgi:hypothetical protein